jgi:hypothetical protein
MVFMWIFGATASFAPPIPVGLLGGAIQGSRAGDPPPLIGPPPDPKPERPITEPWRIKMKAKLETEDAKALYKRRK